MSEIPAYWAATQELVPDKAHQLIGLAGFGFKRHILRYWSVSPERVSQMKQDVYEYRKAVLEEIQLLEEHQRLREQQRQQEARKAQAAAAATATQRPDVPFEDCDAFDELWYGSNGGFDAVAGPTAQGKVFPF